MAKSDAIPDQSIYFLHLSDEFTAVPWALDPVSKAKNKLNPIPFPAPNEPDVVGGIVTVLYSQVLTESI